MGGGNLSPPNGTVRRSGSIPAWAGQPPRATAASRAATVYPRVGGATAVRQSVLLTDSGLSPRGRGNRPDGAVAALCLGSIPAWAGQPQGEESRGQTREVYPRVGGATTERRAPRWLFFGLSPRGRGNRPASVPCLRQARSIPAWAGQPQSLPSCRPILWVYPRVGGATLGRTPEAVRDEGLSPRGRGNLRGTEHPLTWSRSIPAWAGQPLRGRRRPLVFRVYPRVGGATVLHGPPLEFMHGLSPRGRGNPSP